MSEVRYVRDLLEEVLEEERNEKIEIAKKEIKLINQKIAKARETLEQLEAEEDELLSTPIDDIVLPDIGRGFISDANIKSTYPQFPTSKPFYTIGALYIIV